MDILIALLPALFWGSVVLINVLVGGGPYNQIRGTTFGALIIGIILLLTGNAEFVDPTIIIVGLISGAFWALGQGYQLKSISLIGVSKTMPISTGLQLVGTTLFSAVFLGEWSTGTQVTLGLIAMVLLVIGIAMTSIKGKNEASENTKNFGKAMPILLISTVGYVVYVVIAQIFGVDGMNALFFQSIGMAIGGLILSAKHETSIKSTAWNLIPGVIWGIGNLFMFYSQPKVGVATSFSLSQLLVIVSTLGGIFLLGERKDKRQMTGIWAGIVLIVIAAFVLGNIKG
ncbi:MAG: RhaT/GlcU family sugar-proton symporter [Staphylococcus equorum]|uniref:RhaT/GlcU family sugar-proton symporter n=1 Tax=Staphylococcus TaxID=1279 RepID=UPI000623E7AF|nr:RhaT/GlcU family sugar-proton symporter [Staphylococcus equorum]KKI53093.1 glucose uptake protein [Staphylococcus equorum subsp. equorum]MDG0823116.1 RhaT/GlcU family sugar-proton symporter [Staphylococcus equorum]MDK9872264.1 RhaT/GlcU family sugar-proton symporter [Staphylococcus equorum]MDK9878023.1 RhaT/GlcU family sugar-proton symporter [Staphylococcus equorum]MDN5828888.1 RhaT/GlcU family sugar-proton symporter [Staphylococcus equorum]